ncbi:MAG TPA: carboxypeptidase-like regulatory domain-containing protein [Verrucomicrobiae bacterium]|nr:carboxypeptidase-like regulatory domain-containing protein [Verrucomicrobiae bacterium]
MNRRWLPVLAALVLGATPAPLVVGSVRDQHGAPIAGAAVQLLGSSLSPRAVTAADGTFSIEGTGSAVRIRCDYCRPLEAPVAADGTVIAIVQRYDAVRLEGPNPSDLRALPYAHAESDVALTPFVVLEENSNPLHGTSLQDRSISTTGGLLVLDGVPDYNGTDGFNTYPTIPYAAAADVDVERADRGYEYGSIAQSGAFGIDTIGGNTAVAGGNDTFATLNTLGLAGGYSTGPGDLRNRVTAQVPVSLPNASTQIALSSGSADVAGIANDTLASAFSSLRASYERTQGTDLYANFIADRGTDGYTAAYGDANDVWSDVDANAGARSHAVVAPFAEVDVRSTSGWYWSAAQAPYVAGSIDQTRAYAGVSANLPWYSANVAYGLNAIRYVNAYPDGETTPVSGHDGSASLDLHPSPTWDLHASTSSGYVLQTVFGSYYEEDNGYTPGDAQSTDELDLTLQDLRRVRVGLTSFETHSVAGIADASSGAEVAWQIAPAVSLRTWWLEVHPRTGPAQTVGSAWLTAQTGMLRFDVIWQRDLYDLAADMHIDGSVSGPIGVHARWFAQTEQFERARSTNLGVRF